MVITIVQAIVRFKNPYLDTTYDLRGKPWAARTMAASRRPLGERMPVDRSAFTRLPDCFSTGSCANHIKGIWMLPIS